MNKLLTFLRLKPEEFSLTFSLGLLLLANALGMNISYVLSVSGFLNTGGIYNMLLVWLVNYVLILLVTGGQSLFIDRFPRFSLLSWVTLGFIGTFLLLRILFAAEHLASIAYALLYMLAELQWLIFPLVFWVLANDSLSISQTKRLFPLLAAFGIVGKLLGLAIATLAPSLFRRYGIALEELVVFNALVYGLAYLALRASQRHLWVRPTNQQTQSLRETLLEGWKFISKVPSFRYLGLALLLLSACDTIIEFGFLLITDRAFNDVASYQTFYGLYRLTYVLLAFVVQLIITGTVIDKLGVKNAFFALPFAILSGLLWMIALPGVGSGVAAMILYQLAGDTINEPANKVLQGLVPEERRGRVSMFLDSYVVAGGSILGCLGIALMLALSSVLGVADAYPTYIGLGLIAALLAISATVRLHRVYDSSLFSPHLKRRQRSNLLDKL